jgi:hypothetical protein
MLTLDLADAFQALINGIHDDFGFHIIPAIKSPVDPISNKTLPLPPATYNYSTPGAV